MRTLSGCREPGCGLWAYCVGPCAASRKEIQYTHNKNKLGLVGMSVMKNRGGATDWDMLIAKTRTRVLHQMLHPRLRVNLAKATLLANDVTTRAITANKIG